MDLSGGGAVHFLWLGELDGCQPQVDSMRGSGRRFGGLRVAGYINWSPGDKRVSASRFNNISCWKTCFLYFFSLPPFHLSPYSLLSVPHWFYFVRSDPDYGS